MGLPTHPNSAGNLVEGEYSDPASSYAAVTKSDSTVLVGVRALYIGTAGDVSVRAPGSATTVVFKAAAGAVLPIQVEKVMAATTAADIVALF